MRGWRRLERVGAVVSHADFVPVEIRPFDRAAVRRTSFSCGQPSLDEWLRRYAGQQERSDNTRTFVAFPEGQDVIAGYYSTTTYRIELDDLSAELGAGKRRYPIPAVLLARLAVDSRWAQRGVGRQLLVDALRRAAEASRSIGFEVVVVDAIDEAAVTFYARYGFTRFERQALKLFLPTKHLLATLES